jgi:hypothetical protein
MIRRVRALIDELTGKPFHPRAQQESPWGIVLRFLGWPCECETAEIGGCTYPGLGWRCGHRRRRWGRRVSVPLEIPARVTRDLPTPSWVDSLSDDDTRAVLLALHALVYGGEFAVWMRVGGQEMPFAAAREYDEAVTIMERIVGEMGVQ